MLKADQPIVENDIFEVRWMAPGTGGVHHGHPVFLLLGNPNDTPQSKIVIKAESATTPKQKTGMALIARLATAIDPKAGQYAMSAAEVSDLNDWAKQEQTVFGTRNSDLNELVKNLANPASSWIRMDLQQLSDLEKAQAALEAAKKDKAGVRAIAAGLTAAGGLEALGHIIALDLFNGNNDRFTWPGPGSDKPKGGKYNHLMNVGNVLLSASATGALTPIALDSFDPGSTYSNLSYTAVADQEQYERQLFGQTNAQGLPFEWPGRLLDPARSVDLSRFLQGIVDDLNIALGPRSRRIPFATKKRLTGNAAARLQAGVAQAVPILKQKVVTDTDFGNELLIQDRRQILNW